MTKEELAARLHGREYGREITDAEARWCSDDEDDQNYCRGLVIDLAEVAHG